jgi:hypothetical protein
LIGDETSAGKKEGELLRPKQTAPASCEMGTKKRDVTRVHPTKAPARAY